MPVEVYAREIDSRIILAHKLAQHGNSIVIADTWLIRLITNFFRKGVYIGKSMHLYPAPFGRYVTRFFGILKVKDTWYFDKLKKRGYATIYIEEEGGYFQPNLIDLHEALKSQLDTRILKNDDFVLTWGKLQANFFKSSSDRDINNLVINSGHIRFDSYHERYRQVFPRPVEGEYILVNTSSGWPNSAKGILAAFEDMPSFRKEDKSGIDKRFDMWANQTCRFSSMVLLIKAIAENFPKIKVIVRPHPVESLENYTFIFRHFDNIKVIREFSVTRWIIHSKLVIHNACTTGFESVLSGRQVISFLPTELSNHDTGLGNMGYICRTNEEVLSRINTILNLGSHETNNIDCIDSVIPVIKNADLKTDSSEYILDVVNNKLSDNYDNNLSTKRSFLYMINKLHNMIGMSKNIFLLIIGRKWSRAKHFRQVSTGIDFTEISFMVNQLNQIDKSNVLVKRVSNHCYVLSNKE